MSAARSYPLQWPKGWPRTAPDKRESGSRFSQTLPSALSALRSEVQRLGGKNLVLSSNYTLDQHSPKDAGVVGYFEYEGKQVAIPCDRWAKIEANVRAIALTIEAMRGIERWGAKHMISAMFRGFQALPERTMADPWELLGISPEASEEDILKAYRDKAKLAHPDVMGGSNERFNQISEAKDIALATARANK